MNRIHWRRQISGLAVLLLLITTTAHAQNANSRERGMEFGIDLLYLDSSTLDFNGGTKLKTDDDFGVAIWWGYRFSPRLELSFAIDWQSVDYRADLRSAALPGLSASVNGDMDTFTTRINGNYNFMDGPVTPFVTGGIGWAFIDTNIPNSRVQVGCWWDPWYGQICTPYQSTKSVDGFTYQLGAGVRWDLGGSSSLRFGYEKHWLDIDTASGTPDFDEFKVGYIYRY